MSAPELTPRRTIGGVIGVWIAAAVGAVAIGLLVPLEWRAPWLTVALGASLIGAFVIQLSYGRSQGFTERIAASVIGSLLVMGLISTGFGLAAVVPR